MEARVTQSPTKRKTRTHEGAFYVPHTQSIMVSLQTLCSHRQPVTIESCVLASHANHFLWEGLDCNNLAEGKWWSILLWIWYGTSSLHKIQDATLVSWFYCKITLHVSGNFHTHLQEYSKCSWQPLVQHTLRWVVSVVVLIEHVARNRERKIWGKCL
jgi:hypothetical protein